ncbi:zinc ribbon domain-containing protein [Paenibacillus naphthalenovorans]|uniref:zinc ribbon domain-containing protein n=1 Tax=Paenibacillus naphthalenovorans TaxID=162209 RepID=UPI0009EB0043|nr:zinc ribbon domain-containing protein [Paenibacillus naphthalenovorans]
MYQFGNGLIKCLNCGGKYRGKQLRNHKAYTCSTYQKKGTLACSNFTIKEEEIAHIVSTHLKLKGVRVEGSLGEHVQVIEVRDRGYRIYYKDGTNSVVNDNSSPYGTKFKY